MTKKLSAVIPAVVVVIVIAIFVSQGIKHKEQSARQLKVLSYSSFLASWGPGPELAELFKNQTGIEVIYQDADDAGLLLSKLELFPSDVVLGLDRINAVEAKQKFKWKGEFVPFDWAPLTFIYREGEIDPPKSLDELLDPRFKGQISLQDPRTSGPGLQFLFWLVALKGEDGAFDYLNKLRANIRAISPSWSTAYGLFQKGEAKLVYSYLTSPVYHWVNESDRRYQPVVLKEQLINQMELAAVPDSCVNCEGAKTFLQFLSSPDAQKIIMHKNVMLPVESVTTNDTEFRKLKIPDFFDSEQIEPLVEKKKALIERWKDLKL